MNIEEVQTTNKGSSEPVTVESMMRAVEQLRAEFPEMGQCLHWEFIPVQKYFPSQKGTRYMCIRCRKLMVIPDHLIVTKKPANSTGTPWIAGVQLLKE